MESFGRIFWTICTYNSNDSGTKFGPIYFKIHTLPTYSASGSDSEAGTRWWRHLIIDACASHCLLETLVQAVTMQINFAILELSPAAHTCNGELCQLFVAPSSFSIAHTLTRPESKQSHYVWVETYNPSLMLVIAKLCPIIPPLMMRTYIDLHYRTKMISSPIPTRNLLMPNPLPDPVECTKMESGLLHRKGGAAFCPTSVFVRSS